MGMLKITIHDEPKMKTIQMEGKIAGPWVEEVERAWRSLEVPSGSKQLCLDLRAVAFVDAKGTELLREIYQKANARFLTNSPLTQHFADEAMQSSLRTREEGV